MVASLIYLFAVLPQTFVTVSADNIANLAFYLDAYYCVLPPYPEHGSYRVINFPFATPGDRCSSANLDISCDNGYHINNTVKSIFCINGDWSAPMPTCVQDLPECVLTTHQLEGTSTDHLVLPWHAVIYQKKSEDFKHICGGSIITTTKIISAAFCYLESYPREVLLPAHYFKVAVNKMYREYNDARDRNQQLSDVTDINIPSNYVGYKGNYVHNIAILSVRTPFLFSATVLPACLNFDNNLDRNQLTAGNFGKTAVWSLTYGPYDVLNVFDFPYVKNTDCTNMIYTYRRQFVTEEKFCAIYNATWRQITDFGAGIVFLDPTTQRYYLRGVQAHFLEIATERWMTVYTSITKHEDFIKQHL